MNRLLMCFIVGALCLVGWTAHAELMRNTPAAQMWEYEVFTANPSTVVPDLNRRGNVGWELVTIVCPNGSTTPCYYHMKRPR